MIDRARLGKYRLFRRIGVGGMAEVFEAEIGGTQGLGKRLALKVLLPQFQRDAEVVRSFVDEANIVAALAHPNIVPIFDFGKADGMYFLAMEYQDGWDLREVLRRCALARRLLPVPAVAYVGHEVARALHHIHTNEREVVHRDVSPHNVFVNRDGCVKLGDFGVAKATARLARTEQGQIKGKLAYLAPEQASGDPVTCRTDVYACGLVLYEMLTGERFNAGAREADLFANALNPQPRRPSARRPEAAPLDGVVEAALQRHPAMRLRDAELLAEQLAGYLTKHPFDNASLAGFAGELEAVVRAEESGTLTQPPLLGVLHDGRRITITPTQPSGTRQLADRLVRRWPAGLWVAIAAILVGAVAMVAWAMWGPGTPASRDAKHLVVDATVAGVARVDAAPATSDSAVAEPDARAVDRGPDAGRAAVARRGPSPRGHGGRRRRRPRRPPDARVSAVPELASPPAAPAVDRAAARRRLVSLVESARQRGLWPGDAPAYDQQLARARAAVERGSDPQAALQRLEAHVDGFRLDQRFIRRKLARLEQAIARARVSEEERGRLALASQRILRLVLAEQLAAASRQISRSLSRLK